MAGNDAASGQVLPQEGDRVPAQGQPRAAIVGDDLAAFRHRIQWHGGLIELRHRHCLAGGRRCKQRQRLVAESFDMPERLPPFEAK